MEVEDLIINSKEHKILKKFQERLERRYNVTFHMPELNASAESDIIFISMCGEKDNRECIKQFLSEKMSPNAEKIECKKNIIVITLSDSEDELSSCSDTEENSCVPIVEESSCSEDSDFINELSTYTLDNSVCIIESPLSYSKFSKNITNNNTEIKKKECRNTEVNKKMKSKNILPFSQTEEVESCEVSSTTEVALKKTKFYEDAADEQGEFIPLFKKNKTCFEEDESNVVSRDNTPKEELNESVIVLEKPLSARRLRPIVIDGSNVAREHGGATKAFSSKGIQIAVDYFLNRGHTQVTAFVPKFRRFCSPHNPCPTTDPEILDELSRRQLVVYTPSRRLNGKCIASYDDRFIVQLATANGGVIVSNDNYRDLVEEDDSFKEAIEKRLLMFCFVGDILMIPSDPLGRNGPSLNEYLTFPPESDMKA